MDNRTPLFITLLLTFMSQTPSAYADTFEEYGIRFTNSGLIDATTNMRWLDSNRTLGTAADLELYLLDGWRVATTDDVAQLLYRNITAEPDEQNNPLVNSDFVGLLIDLRFAFPNNGIPAWAPWVCFDMFAGAGCENLDSNSFTQVGVNYMSVVAPGEPGLHVSTEFNLTETPLYSDQSGVVCELCEGSTLLVRNTSQPDADYFPARLEIADIIGGDGSAGITLFGRDFNGLFGSQVSPAGDVNGDGIDDVFIGAYREDPNALVVAGSSYVVYGRDTAFPGGLQLFDDAVGTGEDWFRLDGIDQLDNSSISIASGDINGDGLGDLIIGAYLGDPGGRSQAGETYVVFGQNGSFPPAFQLSELATGDGSTGFVLNGVNSSDLSGISVAVGNVNGDNFDDVIVGNSLGESYVYYGRNSAYPAEFELSALASGDGSNGFKITSVGPTNFSSYNYGVGDVNGDTIDDLIIGASTGTSPSVGNAYVVFGQTNTPSLVSIVDIINGDGSTGFRITGIDPAGNLGETIATGDFNADGIDDMLLGAYNANPEGRDSAGQSFIIYGRNTGFPAQFELINLLNNPTGEGTVIYGDQAGSQSGRAVGGIGDINHDGYEDLAISSTGYDSFSQPDVGQVHVIYGSSAPLPALIQLAAISTGDGTSGFVINGHLAGDSLGTDLNTAGDINHDGIADFVIGAAGADTNSDNSGEIYVIFGRASDNDGDGIPNVLDNCSEQANEDQRDTDGDGYGNRCDPDLNNDGIVNFADISLWVPQFNSTGDHADFDGDGNINFGDYSILTSFFLLPPGPSGLNSL